MAEREKTLRRSFVTMPITDPEGCGQRHSTVVYQHFIKPRSRLAVNAAIPILLAIATILAYPSAAQAQLKVIISGGFSTAYRQVLPEFKAPPASPSPRCPA